MTIPGDWRRPESSDKWNLVWCSECAFGQTERRPGPEEIASFYRSVDYYTHGDPVRDEVGSGSTLASRLRHHLAWRADRGRDMLQTVAATLRPADGKVLDLGCGKGALLELLRAQGYCVAGVEPDPVARELARAQGFQVYDGLLEQLPEDVDRPIWSVVILSHVLEHAADPVRAARAIAGLLAPAGAVICEVPNCECLELARSGQNWCWLDAPRHLNFFTRQSIQSLFNQAGLEIAATEFHGYNRQFSPQRRTMETLIQSRLADNTEKTRPLSDLHLWRRFATSVFAAENKKYDSVRVVAKASRVQWSQRSPGPRRSEPDNVPLMSLAAQQRLRENV